MFKNHLKIALRHISRNKGYVFINVIGLGIALACSMIAFVNWQQGATADKFHEKHEQIFRVIASAVGANGLQGNVETPLGTRPVEDIEGVVAGVRFENNGVIIQNGDDVFSENLNVADGNFLEVFTYPLIAGDANAMKDPSKLLITEKTAKKYFAEEDPIGRILTINPGQTSQKDFIVGAVLKNHPSNSCLEFNFLTNIAYVESGPNPDTLENWKTRMAATFLVLKNPNQQKEIEAQLAQYIPLQNAVPNTSTRAKYFLQPLGNVFMDMELHNNWMNEAIHPAFYWGPGLMALLILLTACLNFTNTTISFSNKRLKEMGVRKVMGGGRWQLMVQLLGESLVICTLAAGVGIIIAEYLTPLYNQMWSDVGLDLSLNYFSNSGLLSFLLVAIVGTAIIGGAYPAFYISSFKPSHIFRGSTKFGGDNWLVRSLLGLQIIISLIAVIGGVTFSQNATFQKNTDLGFNVDGIINVNLDGKKHFETFRNIISENPDIQGITGSHNNLGFGEWWSNIGKVEENRSAQMQYIGEDFMEVMGMELLAGRTFDKNLETDFETSIIINEKLAEMQGWEDPVGEQIEMFEETYNVIGLAKEFYANSFFSKPTPNIFMFRKPKSLRTMKIKVANSKLIATNKFLKEKWVAAFPLVPFSSFYQDEMLASALVVSENISNIYTFLAIVTILLAAFGLYSLVSLNVLKRAKEIAVRRVLGASPQNITYTINKHYFLVFLVSGIIGGIVGAWNALFLTEQIFEVYKGINNLSIILCVVGICLIGALTIGSKLLGVLRTNPAETLKSE